jgi:hypothetical protein
MLGWGLTVMVNDFVVPGQKAPPVLFMGATFIIATESMRPLLTAVNAGNIAEEKGCVAKLVPLAASPIDGFEFVQLYWVAFSPVNVIEVVLVPVHRLWFAVGSMVTVGVGLTVNLALSEKLLSQPPFENLALKSIPF